MGVKEPFISLCTILIYNRANQINTFYPHLLFKVSQNGHFAGSLSVNSLKIQSEGIDEINVWYSTLQSLLASNLKGTLE